MCDIAVLADSCFVPWRAARILLEHQRDFSYLECRHLWEDARIDSDGIRVADMHYRLLIVDGLKKIPEKAIGAIRALSSGGRVIQFLDPHGNPRSRRSDRTRARRLFRPCCSLLPVVESPVRTTKNRRGPAAFTLHVARRGALVQLDAEAGTFRREQMAVDHFLLVRKDVR